MHGQNYIEYRIDMKENKGQKRNIDPYFLETFLSEL